MTQPPDPQPPRSDDTIGGWTSSGPDNVKLVYFLYLGSLVLGITALIGLVFAYINRGKSGGWVDTHYTYQIRTFWIGLLYTLIAVLLSIVLIGFILMIAVIVWFVVRSVIGLQRATQGQPVANPRSWLI